MKSLLCALLMVQFSLAIRTQIRSSSFLRQSGDGAGEVGPDAAKPDAAKGGGEAIIDGKRAALVAPPAVVIKEKVEKSKPTNAVVTREFCIEVLKNVAARQAPYFVDGKFTGECRKELVDQCGDRVCEWAKHYKAAASDCPVCPSSCGAKDPSRVAFFSSFPSTLGVVGSPQFFVAIQKEMQARAGSGSGTLPASAARFMGSGVGSGAGSVPPPASPEPVAPCPISGCPKTSVTRGFCQTMLQDIIDGKAPYFIEGKFTGESRSGLISQCGQHICNWALRVHVATIPQCGTSDCCLPQTCKVPQQYIKDVLAKGQLLDIIKLVGKNDAIMKSLDPSKPPASIPAQSDPVPKDTGTPSLRGPVEITKISVDPTANDPRDPDFKKVAATKGDKGDDKDDDDEAPKEPKKAPKKTDDDKDDDDEAPKEPKKTPKPKKTDDDDDDDDKPKKAASKPKPKKTDDGDDDDDEPPKEPKKAASKAKPEKKTDDDDDDDDEPKKPAAKPKPLAAKPAPVDGVTKTAAVDDIDVKKKKKTADDDDDDDDDESKSKKKKKKSK